eukprot:7388749-Prymnesium_polylepis.1
MWAPCPERAELGTGRCKAVERCKDMAAGHGGWTLSAVACTLTRALPRPCTVHHTPHDKRTSRETTLSRGTRGSPKAP